jgi:hypothetical protein
MKIGDRTKFVGIDSVFHSGERQGKTGVIVTDAKLSYTGSNFRSGTCGWQKDGEPGIYVTSLSELEKL